MRTLTPNKFARKYPGISVYARIVRRVAKRYDLKARMYLEFPLCKIVYDDVHEFWIDIQRFKLTAKQRCDYNARLYLKFDDYDIV